MQAVLARAGWALVPMAALVAALTWWGMASRPPATLVEHRRVQGGTVVDLPRPTTAWRLELHRRTSGELRLAQGPEPGCMLRWSADGSALLIETPLPERKDRSPAARPLASLHLKPIPHTVTLARRDCRWEILGDGRRLQAILLPMAISPATSLSVACGEPVTRYELTAHDDTVPAQAGSTVDQSLTRFLADPNPDRLAQVRAEAAALPLADPARNQIRTWLAWQQAREAIGREPPDPTQVLMPKVLSELAAPGLDAALATDLVNAVFGRALTCPPGPLPAHHWLSLRDGWLELAQQSGQAALSVEADRPERLPEEVRLDLLLADHLARRLTRRELQAVPPDAPDWLRMRWRLIAGIPLPDTERGRPLPPLPAAGTPLGIRNQRLLTELELESAAHEIDLTNRLRQALANRLNEQVRLLLETAPSDLRGLLTAILATEPAWGLAEVAQERLDLAVDGLPLRQRHPLAWALGRLLDRRQGRARAEGSPAPPASLADWSELLTGLPRASLLVYVGRPSRIAQAELLAAVLCMQEAMEGQADWPLLLQAVSLRLPLERLARKPDG